MVKGLLLRHKYQLNTSFESWILEILINPYVSSAILDKKVIVVEFDIYRKVASTNARY